jgi:hypothetical protein
MKITKILFFFLILASSPTFAFSFFDLGQLGPKKFSNPINVQPPTSAEISVEGVVVQMQDFADENQQNPRSCLAALLSTSLQEVRLTSSDPFTRPGQDGFEPAIARETLGCRVLYRSLSQNKAVRITARTISGSAALVSPLSPSSLEFRTETVVMNAMPGSADTVTCIGTQCVARGLLSKINYPQDKSAPLCMASLKTKNAAGQAIESQISVKIPTAFGIEWRWMQPDQARQALNAKVSLCDLLTTAQDANLPVSVSGTGNESNLLISTATIGDVPDPASAP